MDAHHLGTGTASRTRVTSSVMVRPRFSNSGRGTRRWPSTGSARARTSSGVTKSRMSSAARATGEDERLRGAGPGASEDGFMFARGAHEVHDVGDDLLTHSDCMQGAAKSRDAVGA